MTNYHSLNHSKWACQYHVVFIPKYRKKAIYGSLRRHLGQVLRELARQRCCWLIQPATATTRNCNTWGTGDIRGEPSRGSRRSRTSRPGERPA